MKLKTLIAVATAAVFTLAGCGTGEDPAPSNQPTSNASGGETAGGGGVGTAALTIAKPDGAITTESHNPYLGDSSASKYAYGKVIFEPLALVNPTGDLGTTPWLAESVSGTRTTRSSPSSRARASSGATAPTSPPTT